MDGRRREILYDNFLALFGIVRLGPDSPRPARPALRTRKPSEPTRAELDAIGRHLGFEVTEGGLWRLDDWVVVTRIKLRSSSALNDIPERIESMRAAGQIHDGDVVCAYYIYEKTTPAMGSLFDAISKDFRTRPMPYLLDIEALRYLQEEVRAGRMSRGDAQGLVLTSTYNVDT